MQTEKLRDSTFMFLLERIYRLSVHIPSLCSSSKYLCPRPLSLSSRMTEHIVEKIATRRR